MGVWQAYQDQSFHGFCIALYRNQRYYYICRQYRFFCRPFLLPLFLRAPVTGIGRRIAGIHPRRELYAQSCFAEATRINAYKARKTLATIFWYFPMKPPPEQKRLPHLPTYYRRNGFHLCVQVDYAFIRNPPDAAQCFGSFCIVENEPTCHDTIAYYGLETTDPELAPKLRDANGRNGMQWRSLQCNRYHRANGAYSGAAPAINSYHAARYADRGKNRASLHPSVATVSPSVPQSLVEIKTGVQVQ